VLIIKRFAFLTIFILSLLALPPIASAEDLSLREIDALIKQTDYDNALEALSSYMKKFPDDLDAAQRRVDSIMNARAYYTRLANDLLDVMEKEPENAEKKLAIIKELESLEKHPTQEHLAFIKQAKSAAEFTYYRAQFRRILEEGAKNARGQKYADAIAVIQSGYYMYRDEFYDENPAALQNAVTQIARDLDAATQNYLAARSDWNDAYKNFIQAVESGGWQNASRAWQNFQARMQSFAASYNRVVEIGGRFDQAFAQLKRQKPDLTEASYLPFMTRFTLGISSIENSGVLGALDCEWNFMLDNCKGALGKAVNQKFDEYSKSAPLQRALETSYAPDQARLADADNFASLALDLGALNGLRKDRAGEALGEGSPLYASSMRSAKSLVENTNSSVANLTDYREALSRFSALQVPENSLDSARTDDSYAKELLFVLRALDQTERKAAANLSESWFLSYKTAAEERRASDKKTQDIKFVDKTLDFKSALDYYQGLNELVKNSSAALSQSAWKSLSDHSGKAADMLLGNYQDLYAEAESLLQNHYPEQAVNKVRSVRDTLASDKNVLSLMKSRLQGNPRQDPLVIQKIDSSISSLDQWSRQGVEIDAKARQELVMAQSSKNQADEIFRRAESNYRADRFSAARSDLQRARELYNESLSHQESDSLRQSSDKALADLGQRINESENKLIVAEVRALKTRAKNDYYAGDFESAESLLNRAESRWAVTNVEEDEEIKNLKLLVQNALSMKTGREIKPTAPLYPEMSQILSNAHQFFDQGEALIKAGKREEALAILADAKKKLQELQMVYPLNQEAALLTLRIDELVDPKQFNESFSRRVQAARQNVKVPATQQQGYSDLLDLAQIRPGYPGLSKLIYDVEIELGIRQKPVDQSALRRSNSLTQEAQRLYSSAKGNEEILRQALARLDQAIALNPNNDGAIMLKDRIQIAVGGKAAVVLSSADEARYNQAIQELRNNNVLGAYTIVEGLLQTPANRRSSKILDLQKQVQARM
jgi:hypothetical protein